MTNTNRYFANVKTAEECKELFRKLAKELHPDCGGNAEEFKAMKAEFEKVFDQLKNKHTAADGTTYEKTTNESAAEFADIIEKLLHMVGCTVELIGSWLWVSGNTYQYREELKTLGFKFGGKKKAWYYHTGEYHKKGKSEKDLQTLREKWGCQQFETTASAALN